MKTRIITSVVGIAILTMVMMFFDTMFFDLVIAAICLLAIHEIFIAFKFDKALYIYWGFVPYILLIMLSNFKYAQLCLLPLSYIFAVYLAICVILNSKTINFAKLGGMVTFSGIVIFCFYSFIHLKHLLPRIGYGYDAIYFMLLILSFAWGGDSAAYFAGRFLGKHKLAPKVSPNKTIEGAIGGVGGSVLVGMLITFAFAQIYGPLVGLSIDNLSVKYYALVAVLGIVSSVLGILGDLFASAIKRQCEIKDYGTIFPGHGGILDRFDSVLFIAPFVSMAITALR